MKHTLLDFSPRGWGRVILWTAALTTVFIAIVLYVDSFNFMRLPEQERNTAILLDFLLPLFLGAPATFYFANKLRQLAIANHKLERYASTDSLTTVLNRGAFTSLVEGYLAEVRAEERRGALLVVDADNFKSINDRYGHDRGDLALKAIAQTIKSMLRGADIVGRIGGEEFGVFLPGSSLTQAEAVAERIRGGVLATDFAPDGDRVSLTVSVGGAAFDKRLPFGDLFRVADQQLYAAKTRGRNRVAIASVVGYGSLPMAAA
jgi:diguanylate cyclase (GGDEF)-like protein